jgi:ABC-type sugar transport system substrate-binding protein
MKTTVRGIAGILAMTMGFLCLAGCAKPAVQDPAATPTATLYQPQVQTNAVDVTNTLLGFIIPYSQDIALCTAMHGFLRTAENLGYPAKLYHAAAGAQSVAAVEQAAADGCKGLLIWDPNSSNAVALEKAAALSIPAVVPYYDASGTGVTACVVADLLGYTEEIALGLAERMVERECKAGKILVYGREPQAAYEKFVASIAEYYPQYNVGYFVRTGADEQAAIDELAEYILWNRDIKGLFCADTDGATIAVRAREKAQSRFKAEGAPEASTSAKPTATPQASASPGPEATVPPAPASATPVPAGLVKSILISVAGYGISEETISLMRTEDIYAFVLQPYYEASAQSLMMLDRILRGESVPAAYRLNMPIVRKVTLDKYVFIYEQVQDWFQLRNG